MTYLKDLELGTKVFTINESKFTEGIIEEFPQGKYIMIQSPKTLNIRITDQWINTNIIAELGNLKNYWFLDENICKATLYNHKYNDLNKSIESYERILKLKSKELNDVITELDKLRDIIPEKFI